MVATRKSLPNLVTADPLAQDGAKIPKELRKLHIDGKDTMRGQARVEEPTREEVYHWRGAVYKVTADTPRDWIEQQPERFRRPREEKESSAKPPSKKRKSLTLGEELEEAAVEKRPRKSSQKGGSTLAEPTYCEERKRSASRAPRRKSTALANAAIPTTERPDKPPVRRANPYDESDARAPLQRTFARAASQDTFEDIEDAREAARKQGCVVEMLPEPEEDASAATKKMLAVQLGKTLVRISQVNSQIDRIRQRYDGARVQRAIERVLERRQTHHSGVEGGQEQRVGGPSPRPSPDPARRTGEGAQRGPDGEGKATGSVDVDDVQRVSDVERHEPGDGREDGDQVRSEEELNEAQRLDQLMTTKALFTSEIYEETMHSPAGETSGDDSVLQHDSAASGISASASSSRTSPPTSTPELPQQNRGGHALRWSLDRSHLAKLKKSVPASSAAIPGPGKQASPSSWNRSVRDRAESAIHKGRLDGESKSARRRRVKRELRLMESWEMTDGGRQGEER